MTTKSTLIIAFIVLIFLPLLWVILPGRVMSFWYDFGWWVLGFVVIVGGALLINKLKKQ